MAGKIEEAIALVYDGEQAPTLSARGEGDVAEEIVRLAIEHQIPIYQNADLAKLLVQLELGEQIPVELYRTIAEIIAFAWYLKGKAPPGFGDKPQSTQPLLPQLAQPDKHQK